MRNNLKKGFCLLLAAWLLVANVGFAWSQSTCLFTGIQKTSWQYKANCCGEKSTQNPIQKTTLSRSSCCHYQHFQVKHQASFASEKQAFALDSWITEPIASFDYPISSFAGYVTVVTPHPKSLLPSVRRALLQTYRI
ncbi:MAG: HYC_CC_PP family protein [Aquirufa sp.]